MIKSAENILQILAPGDVAEILISGSLENGLRFEGRGFIEIIGDSIIGPELTSGGITYSGDEDMSATRAGIGRGRGVSDNALFFSL